MFYSKPITIFCPKAKGPPHKLLRPYKIFCFLIYLIVGQFAWTQTNPAYHIESLGTHTDLHTSEFNCVKQDIQGFIWIGTNNGLCRFDGYSFSNYHFSDSRRIGKINVLAIGGNDILYMGGENGLFYEEQGEIKALPLPFGEGEILVIHPDRLGGLWIGGLSFVPFYIDTFALKQLSLGKEVELNPVASETEWLELVKEMRTYSISTDQSGHPYFGTLNRIVTFDGQQFKVLFEENNSGFFIHSLHIISADSIYWGGRHAPFQLLTPEDTQQITELWAVEMVESPSGLHFLTESGIVSIKGEKTFSLVGLNEISHSWFQDLTIDREGNFWIAAHGELLKVSPSLFTHYTPPEHPLLKTNFSISASKKGQILVGGHHGEVFIQDGQQFIPFLENRDRIVSRAEVQAIFPEDDGRIWFGTAYQGIVLHRNGQLENYSVENGLADNGMYFFFKSPKGELWTGGDGGISRIRMDANGEVNFDNYKAQNLSARYPKFQGCFEDNWGNVWAGSDIGLYLLDQDTLQRQAFSPPNSAYPAITKITYDHFGTLWMSTQGEGLWQCSVNEKQELEVIKQWTISDEMASDLWLDLHIDQQNKIWVVNNQGICCLSLQDEPRIRCFDKADGWRKQSSRYLQMYESKDSLLWIAGTDGLTSFPLYGLPSNEIPPVAYIQSVSLMGGKEDIYSYSNNPGQRQRLPQRVKLPYNKNYLRFQFTTTSYIAPAKNRFKYRLLGVDKEWLMNDGGKTATYPALTSGNYRFEVMSANNDGLWSKVPATYSFSIYPPWWRSSSAYLVYIFLAIGTLLFAHRQIIRREELKNQLKVEQLEKEKVQEIDQLRTRFFANISHEFRTPLTLIKAPLEDLLTSRKNHEDQLLFYQMHQNTERLLHLVNQLLDLSRLESGALELQLEIQDMYALLRQLAGNFQSLASQKQLDFQINVPLEELWLHFDQDKMEKIVLNLLSNAIKFAPEMGWVKIAVSFLKTLKLWIGNSGDVIPPEEQEKLFDRFYQAGDTRHQGTGIGLALVRELVELYQGKVGLESTDENGTWFWVELPLEKAGAIGEATVASKFNGSSFKANNKREHKVDQSTKPIKEEKPLVLLVEDHEEVRTYIKQKLESNFEIIEAEDGETGLEKAINQLPDLIISDLMMPKMDGITLCQHIKADQRTDHIPFILLTAKADIDSRLVGLKTGANDYLAKPFNNQELLFRAKNLIAQRQKLREHFANFIQIEPRAVKVNSAEQEFLKKAINVVEAHLDKPAFSATDFCKAMHLSRTQLHRKLKNLTGHSTTDFIRNLRLQRASQLLAAKSANVTQVAFEVGFSSQSYFTKCFKKKYGRTPSEYQPSINQ